MPVKPSPAGTGGRIIFVSATIHYRTMPFQSHVSVAKAGIDALSHSVAIEFGPLGVTSNIIAPGPIASTEVRFTYSRHLILFGVNTYNNAGHGPSSPLRRKRSLRLVPALGSPRVCPRHCRCIRVSLREYRKLRYWADASW